MKNKITSPKLKQIIMFNIIITIIVFLCIIGISIFANVYIKTVYLTITITLMSCLILAILTIFFYYKDLKQITNASTEYFEFDPSELEL